MTPTQPPQDTHTHPTPNLGGCEEDLLKKTAPDGTDKHTHGHGNSMTDPAQRAESVKIAYFHPICSNISDLLYHKAINWCAIIGKLVELTTLYMTVQTVQVGL